jgi:hypothetical protein
MAGAHGRRNDSRPSDRFQLSLLSGPIGAPHLFQIVELAHVGLENMNDGVMSVEQDPIAMGKTLDARRRKTGGLAGLYDAIGDRPHMNAGASGGDNHEIGEGGFAAKIDRYDVFRFGVFKAGEHCLRELVRIGSNLPDRGGARRERRFFLGLESQCWNPPLGGPIAGAARGT